MRPLEDITVVALEQAVAAPFASRQLADLGARVIKIEWPQVGDFARGYDTAVNGTSSFFFWLNRSKESLTLDLKQPEGKEVVEQLLAGADVFLHNLAPGAVDRLGFAASRLVAQYPSLIVCEMSGYGSSGPYQKKKAYDLLIQAETGVLSVTGTPETPSKAGMSIADIAGGMYAYSSILAALYRRERTGKGGLLEVALFDALSEWMSYPAYFTGYGGAPLKRTGATHPAIAPYGPYPAGDGSLVMLGIQNDREWVRFCEVVLQQPGLATDPRFATNPDRVANRDQLDEEIRAAFQPYSANEVVERLDAAAIASARANTTEEFLKHPQLAARDRWQPVDTPSGQFQALLPPVIFDDVDYAMNPVPDLGAHTEGILRELGYDDDAIARFRDEGIT